MWVPKGCVVEVHTLTVIAQCWQLFDAGWKGWLVQGTKLASETLRSAWVSRDVQSRIWTLSLDVVAFGNAVCDMLNLCFDPNVIFSGLCHSLLSPLMFYSESSPSACSLLVFFSTFIFKMSFYMNTSHVTAINKGFPPLNESNVVYWIYLALSGSRQAVHCHRFDSQTIGFGSNLNQIWYCLIPFVT